MKNYLSQTMGFMWEIEPIKHKKKTEAKQTIKRLQMQLEKLRRENTRLKKTLLQRLY